MPLNEADVINKIKELIAEIVGQEKQLPVETIADANLVTDLKLDSLDVIGLFFRLEETYGIKIPEPDIDEHGLANVGDLARYVVKAKGA